MRNIDKRDIDDATNEKLRKYQAEWYKKILCPWIDKNKNCAYAQPFFTGVYACKDDGRPLILFVGQETNGWGKIIDFDGESEIALSQSYAAAFTKNNVLDRDKNEELNYKGTPSHTYDPYVFWTFIRGIFDQTNIRAVWTELDKIRYIDKKLCVEDEEALHKSVCCNKSLLLLEIETLKPDLVVFLTGPHYYKSMEYALQREFRVRLTKTSPISEFSLEGIPCVWTYHPRGLNGLGSCLKNYVSEEIVKRIPRR